jgi:hypothetical protein
MACFLFLLIPSQHAAVQVGFINQEVLSMDIRAKRIEIGFVDADSSPIELPGIIQGNIHANTEWVLLCSAQGDFLAHTGSIIPIERLAWRMDGGEWFPFEMGDISLLEGPSTSENGVSFSMDLRLDLKWKDKAGDFLTNIDFTLMKK